MDLEKIAYESVASENFEVITSSFSGSLVGGVAGGIIGYSLAKKLFEKNQRRQEIRKSGGTIIDVAQIAIVLAAVGGAYAGANLEAYLEQLITSFSH